jgi:hypothetical protein
MILGVNPLPVRNSYTFFRSLSLQEPEGIGVGGQIKTQLKTDAMVIFAGPESRKSHR